MSSMISLFSSSSKTPKKGESESGVDALQLLIAFKNLKKSASIQKTETFKQETESFKDDIYKALENTKVDKKKKSTLINIETCKEYFEQNIKELLEILQSSSLNSIVKSKFAILVISFYNYFDNIEGDNNKTILGDAAPLSTKKAVNNFIKACNILEECNPEIKPIVATVNIADNDLSASNSEYNDLASSISHVNLAQSTATDENVPYVKTAINYEARPVIVAQVVKDTSEITTFIDKYKNISDYATLAIFGNLEKNALNIYLQRYRAFPILDAVHEISDPEHGRFHSRTVYWNDYQIMDNQKFSKYIPILNLLGIIQIVNFSIESLRNKEDESKRGILLVKIKQEIKALQEYVQTANLIPENISYLHIGIPPKKSWMDFHYESVIVNPEFEKTTCAQAYKEVMQASGFFIDKSNKQFLEEILPELINGKKPEIANKRKGSILKRLM